MWRVILLCLWSTGVSAQVYHSDFLRLDHIWESRANPAFDLRDQQDSSGLKIQLANAAFGVASQGSSFSDFLVNNGDGIYSLNTQALLDNLDPTNTIKIGASVETLGVGFQLNDLVFSISHAIRFNSQLDYPKELIDIYANGNAQYIGERVDIGIGLIANAYSEYTFGLSYGKKNWRIGGRVKYLCGIQDVSTSRSTISLQTRDDIYQLDFENDFQINTSSLLEYNGIRDISLNYQSRAGFLWSQSKGVAFDIGVEYVINDQWRVDLAMFDIGSIEWTDQVSNYSSHGSYSFEGIDLIDYLKEDLDVGFTDSLEVLLKIEETNVAYSTDLPFHAQVGLSYQLNQSTDMNIVGKYMKFRNDELMAIGGNVNRRLSKALTVGASYIYTNENPINIGLAAQLRLGVFEIQLAQENILFVLNDTYARTRLGFALVF